MCYVLICMTNLPGILHTLMTGIMFIQIQEIYKIIKLLVLNDKIKIVEVQ